jgi:gamma-glutamyltranspeptidase/glutathione hydrolase
VKPTRRFAWLGAAALLAGCAGAPGPAPDGVRDAAQNGSCAIDAAGTAPDVRRGAADASQPEPGSGYRLGLRAVEAHRYLVVTAHPLASRAGCEVLRAGGSAADAAVAVQAVLGLVEPQSSGLGGGAFIVHYDAATRRVSSFDGRETAPAAATENDLRWIDTTERRAPLPDVRTSGRSIGVPGTVRALELLHRRHGRQPWGGLFDAGIALAEGGFAMPRRMAEAVAQAQGALQRDPDAAAYFLQPDGRPRAAGSPLRNPAYADTLRRIAGEGADAFYRGEIAADIVAEVARTEAGPAAPGPLTPGRMTLADLAGYRAVEREPVCADYRAWRVCGMPPPSSGGIAVAQALGILAQFDLAAVAPAGADRQDGRPSVVGAHLLAEALRLAFADRNAYVADTDFVPLPGAGVASMLAPHYLRERAALIRPDRSLGSVGPGRFDAAAAPPPSANEGKGTSQVSIVDAQGNALSMTTTIESSLGAYRFVRGFLLNNELTDFAPVPTGPSGAVANRLQGGKRPRSSMAPTLVFERGADDTLGELRVVTGSPGGAAIIAYVTKTLVGLLDWGWDAQQAAAAVNVGAFNTPVTVVGGEHPALRTGDPLVTGLAALGHEVVTSVQTSGVASIVRVPTGRGHRLQGGVDPRREGLALGR